MTVKAESLYRCPICSNSLSLQSGSYKCNQNHSFDVAKENYVNLLPVNKKRSKSPGDSKSMLQARRLFLNNEYYKPLLTKIAQTTSPLLEEGDTILDLGCGEGYYSHQLIAELSDAFKELSFAGVDIAKPAIQMAAKQSKKARFCVASSAELPYQDAIFDLVFTVFAPYLESELIRIMKPEGYFLLVGPGPEHLKELAGHIYETVNAHRGNPVKASNFNELVPIDNIQLKFQCKIPAEQLENLLMMTPYYWSINQENKAKLLSLESLLVTFDFSLQLLQYQPRVEAETKP